MLRAEFRELLEFGVIIFFIGLCVGLILSIVFNLGFGTVLAMIASFVKNARGIAAIAGETLSDARMASEGPRATVSGTASVTVGRGPVPRRATIAGGTRSDARMQPRAPRYGA